MKTLKTLIVAIAIIGAIINRTGLFQNKQPAEIPEPSQIQITEQTVQIPEFHGKNWETINNNNPLFTAKEKQSAKASIHLSEMDNLKRCGVCTAVLGPETLPKEKRGYIGMVKPSGWRIAKYNHISGKYLFHRSHLLGYQLTGLNSDPRNLITGTQHMNVIGMLPFENRVADYIKQTKNHVLYRVTPVFKDKELVARGVNMEAYSIEDYGKLHFNVYIHNIQPGVQIDYQTGKSKSL